MYHRSVATTGRVGSNTNNRNGLSYQQNENLIHRGKNQNQLKPTKTNNSTSANGKSILRSTSQTPAAKKGCNRRRALGDISNKKGDCFSVVIQEKSKPQQNEVLKSRSTNIFSTTNNSTTKKKLSNKNANSLLPEIQTTLIPRANRVSSTQKAHLAIFSEQLKPSQSQRFTKQPINDRAITANSFEQVPSFITTNQVQQQSFKEETVPDIELPAGRTWKEQLENELKDEDDLASTSSIDSILNLGGHSSPMSMWDGMREAHLKREKEEAENEDKQVQEQIQVMMEREREEVENSLDHLYDVIDNLDIFSDCNRDVNAIILEEERNIPDSLLCDAYADNDFLFALC
mmetsp:Transcript_10834/g.12257  ORF Transcript_10834/g.12257 Transcript_10834/m.12257 type:complete len:345 (-) Transcript_10834:2012-3046(-)